MAESSFMTEFYTQKGGLYSIVNYMNNSEITRHYHGVSENQKQFLMTLGTPDLLKKKFEEAIEKMVSGDKHNTLNIDYVMKLYKTSPIILVKYTLPNNGKQVKLKLDAFCLAHMMDDSIHIDIIMAAPGQGNVFMKNIKAIALRDEFSKNYITLDSLPEPLGFYLKSGFKFLTDKMKKELMPDRKNIKNFKSKKLWEPLKALNRKSGLRWNKNTKESSKEAAEELLKFLPNKYLKKMDSWNGITEQLENKSGGIFVYDKITFIMFKKITSDIKPSPRRQLFGSPKKPINVTGSVSAKIKRKPSSIIKRNNSVKKRRRSSTEKKKKRPVSSKSKKKKSCNNSQEGSWCSMMGGAWLF